jgi:DNA-directed RNA polymerase specialized sigma24 family protein
MIVHINDRLNQWARWRLGASGRGGSPYPAYNLPHKPDDDAPPDPRRYVPINDLECCDTDRCVCALSPPLRKAVDEFYIRTETVERKAQYCGCSVKTLYRRIDEAHRLIMGWLNDLSCGVTVPAWSTPVPAKVGLDVVTRNPYISGTLV